MSRRRVDLPRCRRQRPGAAVEPRGRGPRTGGVRAAPRRTLAGVRPTPAGATDPAGDDHGSAGGHAGRPGARPRRLPLRPADRTPRGGRAPRAEPAGEGPRGDHHPVRPRTPAGAAARVPRPGRAPGRGPGLHAGGGGPDGHPHGRRPLGRHPRRAGRTDRGLARGPLPRRTLPRRPTGPRRLRAPLQREQPVHRGLPHRGGPQPASGEAAGLHPRRLGAGPVLGCSVRPPAGTQ